MGKYTREQIEKTLKVKDIILTNDKGYDVNIVGIKLR